LAAAGGIPLGAPYKSVRALALLEIGGAKLEKLDVAICDAKAIGKANGIIGYNF
jgi:hypothetical protein